MSSKSAVRVQSETPVSSAHSSPVVRKSSANKRSSKVESDDSAPATPVKTKSKKTSKVESDDSAPATPVKTKSKKTSKVESDDSAPSTPVKTKSKKTSKVESDDEAASEPATPVKHESACEPASEEEVLDVIESPKAVQPAKGARLLTAADLLATNTHGSCFVIGEQRAIENKVVANAPLTKLMQSEMDKLNAGATVHYVHASKLNAALKNPKSGIKVANYNNQLTCNPRKGKTDKDSGTYTGFKAGLVTTVHTTEATDSVYDAKSKSNKRMPVAGDYTVNQLFGIDVEGALLVDTGFKHDTKSSTMSVGINVIPECDKQDLIEELVEMYGAAYNCDDGRKYFENVINSTNAFYSALYELENHLESPEYAPLGGAIQYETDDQGLPEIGRHTTENTGVMLTMPSCSHTSKKGVTNVYAGNTYTYNGILTVKPTVSHFGESHGFVENSTLTATDLEKHLCKYSILGFAQVEVTLSIYRADIDKIPANDTTVTTKLKYKLNKARIFNYPGCPWVDFAKTLVSRDNAAKVRRSRDEIFNTSRRSKVEVPAKNVQPVKNESAPSTKSYKSAVEFGHKSDFKKRNKAKNNSDSESDENPVKPTFNSLKVAKNESDSDSAPSTPVKPKKSSKKVNVDDSDDESPVKPKKSSKKVSAHDSEDESPVKPKVRKAKPYKKVESESE